MLNNVFVEGNLVSDIQVRVINDKLQVGKFALAVEDKVGPQKEKTTSFVEFEAWNKTCQLLASNFTKGAKVCVFGKLKQEQFVAKDGTKVNRLKVVVDQVLNLPAFAPRATSNQQEQEVGSGDYQF